MRLAGADGMGRGVGQKRRNETHWCFPADSQTKCEEHTHKHSHNKVPLFGGRGNWGLKDEREGPRRKHFHSPHDGHESPVALKLT